MGTTQSAFDERVIRFLVDHRKIDREGRKYFLRVISIVKQGSSLFPSVHMVFRLIPEDDGYSVIQDSRLPLLPESGEPLATELRSLLAKGLPDPFGNSNVFQDESAGIAYHFTLHWFRKSSKAESQLGRYLDRFFLSPVQARRLESVAWMHTDALFESSSDPAISMDDAARAANIMKKVQEGLAVRQRYNGRKSAKIGVLTYVLDTVRVLLLSVGGSFLIISGSQPISVQYPLVCVLGSIVMLAVVLISAMFLMRLSNLAAGYLMANRLSSHNWMRLQRESSRMPLDVLRREVQEFDRRSTEDTRIVTTRGGPVQAITGDSGHMSAGMPVGV